MNDLSKLIMDTAKANADSMRAGLEHGAAERERLTKRVRALEVVVSSIYDTAAYCKLEARRMFWLREHWVGLARLHDGLESCYIAFARSANTCAVRAMKEARKYT